MPAERGVQLRQDFAAIDTAVHTFHGLGTFLHKFIGTGTDRTNKDGKWLPERLDTFVDVYSKYKTAQEGATS